MRRLTAVIVVIVLLMAALFGLLLLSRSNAAAGFSPSDIKAPLIIMAPPINSTVPTPATLVSQDYSGLGWEYSITEDIYAKYGGVMELRVINGNTAGHTFFVYGFGIQWASGEIFLRNASVYIHPHETRSVGTFAFGAPSSPGMSTYKVVLKLAVSNSHQTAWYDHGLVSQQEGKEVIIKPLDSKSKMTTEANPLDYYNRVNARVSFSDVQSVANQIKQRYPGNYSTLQIAEAYSWMRENIAYEEDGPTDYWQSARETLERGAGDCEDHAILISSIIGALGGTARVNIIEGHAFPTVFVASTSSEMSQVQRSLASYYGMDPSALNVCYLVDQYGYWLVIDPTGFPYAGGLPAQSAPTTDGAWSPQSDFLYTVDATGRTAGSLFGLDLGQDLLYGLSDGLGAAHPGRPPAGL